MYGLTDSARLTRDAFYVTVGFGVLGFQKLQVRRRELEKELSRRTADAPAPLAVVHETRRQVASLLGHG